MTLFGAGDSCLGIAELIARCGGLLHEMLRHARDLPGPLHAPAVLLLFPFHLRDAVTGKWVKARYLAERPVTEAHYREWRSSVSRKRDGTTR